MTSPQIAKLLENIKQPIISDTNANKDEYYLKLTMNNNNDGNGLKPKILDFKLNLEQLTELHQSLQQALKIIESEAANFTKNI